MYFNTCTTVMHELFIEKINTQMDEDKQHQNSHDEDQT